MAKVKETEPQSAIEQKPSFARFILWESVGIVGFLHILFYAPPNDPTPLLFLGNALVFAAAYPVLYYYKQLNLPLFLKFLLSPLEQALRVILMANGFLWIVYLLYASSCNLTYAQGALSVAIPCFQVIKGNWMFMAPFYVMDYFFFFEHLWGLSRVNFTFWASVGMISDSVSGVVGGLLLGRTLISKWGQFFGGPDVQGILWMDFILIGVAAVVWFGNKTRKG
ncbi:MAG TPA: hypothetical protein VHE12_00915 [bacterium]|nr:hypothetical protein [bacterium]